VPVFDAVQRLPVGEEDIRRSVYSTPGNNKKSEAAVSSETSMAPRD